MKHVDRFVRMSRFESLSLHEVCKGLKVCLQIYLLKCKMLKQSGYLHLVAGVSKCTIPGYQSRRP